MLRFLSTLPWVEERGFIVEGGGLAGGNLTRTVMAAPDHAVAAAQSSVI